MNEINNKIAKILTNNYGIDVLNYDAVFLNKSIHKRLIETQCSSEADYYKLLENNAFEADRFIHSLQISYSEFFRNSLTFSVLEKIILPSIVMKKIKSNRNEIRIWSAACAAGQETYSIAILLKEILNSVSEKINLRIFATDQSESQINEAKEGVFSDSALNCLNLRRTKQWFEKKGDNYIVKQELKDNIDFSVFDLFSEQYSCPPPSIFGDFDLVICANLLFYFKPEFRKKIITKTGNCLSTNGYYVTGETEREILINADFEEVYPQSSIFQKR